MEIYEIHTGYFKLDGGAMFGVVPKQMWKKINPPDENNMCTWSMRCLLVKEGSRLILFDTGMGEKQDEKFKSHFEPHGERSLFASIKEAGFDPAEITDVFLTHLHFDHCGGALVRDDFGEIKPAFPNAIYWTNEAHLNWALSPNPREKASFLKENIVPLIEQKRLQYIDVRNGIHFTENITVDFYDGHTEKMMVPTIKYGTKNIIFPADLLPSVGHVRMPYVMSYDIRPLVTLKEKATFYEKLEDDNAVLFFEHDREQAFGRLLKNEKGRYSIQKLDATDIYNNI